MGSSYYLVVDAGTTAIKVFAYSDSGEIVKQVQRRVLLLFPQPGWVEQDPVKYWEQVADCVEAVCSELGKPLAVGVTNQRATTVVWDRDSGNPLYNMITWQDARSADVAEQLSRESLIRLGKLTGRAVELLAKLLPQLGRSRAGKFMISLAHFKFGSNQPAVHLRWLIDNVPEVSQAIESGKAAFGTLDSWLAWNLVRKHVTDYTNASATGMFDPFSLRWSERILKILGVPGRILPQLVDNAGVIGYAETALGAPLAAMIADQQASLFSAGGTRAYSAKMTNGTGTFVDVNVGGDPKPALEGTYPMVALKVGSLVRYLVEGIEPATGSAVDWLVEVGLVEAPAEADELAGKAESAFGVTFIPSLTGLGTPYWVNEALGCIFGLSRGVKREHLVRALLEGLAFRLAEVIQAVEKVAGVAVKLLVADGNASRLNALLQLTADLSGKRIARAKNLEGSSRGAFLLAKSSVKGLSVEGAWEEPEIDRVFEPRREAAVDLARLRKALRSCVEFAGARLRA